MDITMHQEMKIMMMTLQNMKIILTKMMMTMTIIIIVMTMIMTTMIMMTTRMVTITTIIDAVAEEVAETNKETAREDLLLAEEVAPVDVLIPVRDQDQITEAGLPAIQIPALVQEDQEMEEVPIQDQEVAIVSVEALNQAQAHQKEDLLQ